MNRIKFLLLLILLVVAGSCEKERDLFSSRPQPTTSTARVAASSGSQQAVSSPISQQEALKVINANYKDSLFPIRLEQRG